MSSNWQFPLVAVAALGMSTAACKGDDDAKSSPKLGITENPEKGYLIGIRAEDFRCESALSIDEATNLFGGRVERVESPYTPPAGVPSACNYVSFAEGREPKRWSFDLDCREGAHDDAAQLMVQYADAPNAAPVLIGRSALDHNDSALLFIDDDTPCYGRVLGPERELRLQIATIIVPKLAPQTAPTGPQFVVED